VFQTHHEITPNTLSLFFSLSLSNTFRTQTTGTTSLEELGQEGPNTHTNTHIRINRKQRKNIMLYTCIYVCIYTNTERKVTVV